MNEGRVFEKETMKQVQRYFTEKVETKEEEE